MPFQVSTKNTTGFKMFLQLFKTKYLAYVQGLQQSANKSNPAVKSECITSESFDLMDKRQTLEQNVGEGCVTYHNKTSIPIVAIDYENFLNNFVDSTTGRQNLKHGTGRCDVLVLQEDRNLFFIANELSSGNPKSKWPKAAKQLGSTVKNLKAVPEISEYLDSIENLYCVVSCKNEISSPLAMADAFSLPAKLIKYVQEKDWPPINKYGFKVVEATQVYIYDDKIKFAM